MIEPDDKDYEYAILDTNEYWDLDTIAEDDKDLFEFVEERHKDNCKNVDANFKVTSVKQAKEVLEKYGLRLFKIV